MLLNKLKFVWLFALACDSFASRLDIIESMKWISSSWEKNIFFRTFHKQDTKSKFFRWKWNPKVDDRQRSLSPFLKRKFLSAVHVKKEFLAIFSSLSHFPLTESNVNEEACESKKNIKRIFINQCLIQNTKDAAQIMSYCDCVFCQFCCVKIETFTAFVASQVSALMSLIKWIIEFSVLIEAKDGLLLDSRIWWAFR